VEVDGERLAVRLSGAGDGVLLVHGTAPAAWGGLPGLLAEHARVVDYDRRSFMDSTGDPPKALTRHADDAAALLERLGAAPAVVVGWSIGGIVALELALRRPELVKGLVLLEPPFRAKRHPSRRMLGAIGGAKLLVLTRRPERGGERFLAWALSRRDGSDDVDRLAPGYRDAVRRCGASIVRETDAGTGEHLDRAALGALRLPAIVLRGTESSPEFGAAARRLAEALPDAPLLDADGSGHGIAVDAPEAVAAAVTRML
jgi:pimeloyl-ACP methyl ester carboxylesterase